MEEKKKSYKIITWTNFQRGKKFSEKKGEKQSFKWATNNSHLLSFFDQCFNCFYCH